MEIEHTRRRFKKRIEFERQIITSINSISTSDPPLNGLSEGAISSWKEKSSLPNKTLLAEQISKLSHDLMLFCDNSRNAFDVCRRINSSAINQGIQSLTKYI